MSRVFLALCSLLTALRFSGVFLALYSLLSALYPLGSTTYAASPPVTAVAFAPDGRFVVVGSQAGVVVYSWPELKQQREIDTKLVNVHDLAFSPTGHALAIGGGSPAEAGVVEVVEWPGGKSLQVCNGHKDCVLAVSWQSDSTFATAGLDNDVVVWNAETGQPAQRLKGHSRGVSAVCFLAKVPLLVSAGIDQNLRVWSMESGMVTWTLNNHTREVHQLAVRPSAEGLPMIASVSEDRTVRLWQPTIGRMVRFAQLDSVPLAVGWLPDGSRVVVAAADGHVRLIDPDTAEVTQDLPAIDSWAYSLAVHPSDGSLLIGGRSGQLQRIVPNAAPPQ